MIVLSGGLDKLGVDVDQEQQKQLLTSMDAIYEDSGKASCTTADCPVCRKPHVLDLDQLQVSPCGLCLLIM